MIFHQQNEKIFNDSFNDIFQKNIIFLRQQKMIAIIKIMIAIIISENIIRYH